MLESDSKILGKIKAELDKAVTEVENAEDYMTREAANEVKERVTTNFIKFCHKLLLPERTAGWDL